GRFLGVLEELLALREDDPHFEAARPVCAGTVRPLDGTDLPLIDDPLTARAADLFDVVNEVVVQLLARYFAAVDETPAQRARLADAAVGLMFAGIRTAGQRRRAMPFGPSRPGMTAGPTFTIVQQSATVLPHRYAAWVVLEERLREAAAFGRALAHDDPSLGLGRVCDALDRYATTLATG